MRTNIHLPFQYFFKKAQWLAIGSFILITGNLFSADMIAIAISKVGNAVYERNNKQSPITKGMIFEVKDKVITMNGTVDIQIGQNSIIRVAKNSVLLISKLLEENGAEKTELNLNKGAILTKVTKKMDKNSDFKVVTPTITAGVRGTQFMIQEGEDMDASGDNKLDPGAYVKEGLIEVKTSYSPAAIAVEAGQELITSQKKLKAEIMDDYALGKMKILDTLNVMKEANYKNLQEQREKNKELLKK